MAYAKVLSSKPPLQPAEYALLLPYLVMGIRVPHDIMPWGLKTGVDKPFHSEALQKFNETAVVTAKRTHDPHAP